MKINIDNPRYKIAFFNCDGSISHSNSKFMQLVSNLSKSEVERIIIFDDQRIKYTQSYKCLETDFLRKKALFEASKYSILYPQISLGCYTSKVENVDSDFLTKFFNIDHYSISRTNFIIVTCSDTDIKTINQIKELTNNNPYNTFIHLHLETGNDSNSGVLYSAMSQRVKEKIDGSSFRTTETFKVRQPYLGDFDYLDTGDLTSKEMLSQCSLGGTTIAEALANIVHFDTLPLPITEFNQNSMSIGQGLSNEPPMKPIKLLQPKKVYKKKGKSKKSKKTSSKIHVVIGGTGATGSFYLSETLQALNLVHENIGTIALVDGDIIEAKNLRNQRCLKHEVDMPKVIAFADRYGSIFTKLNIKPYNEFLYELNEDILKDILGLPTIKDETIIWIGCFDNIPIRKSLDNLFRKITKCRNFLYLDSGNGAELREGQTVMGYKQYGKVILNPVASSGLDNGAIRSNTEKISDFVGTCTRASADKPQNITTNILAARSLANHSDKVFMHREIHAHYSKFYLEPISIESFGPINQIS